MRLYGSQSRFSKSAARHARAHRPLTGFASVPTTPRRPPLTRRASGARQGADQPAATTLVPRSV